MSKANGFSHYSTNKHRCITWSVVTNIHDNNDNKTYKQYAYLHHVPTEDDVINIKLIKLYASFNTKYDMQTSGKKCTSIIVNQILHSGIFHTPLKSSKNIALQKRGYKLKPVVDSLANCIYSVKYLFRSQ